MISATMNLCTNARSDNGEDVMGVHHPTDAIPQFARTLAPGAGYGQPTSGASASPEYGTYLVSGVSAKVVVVVLEVLAAAVVAGADDVGAEAVVDVGGFDKSPRRRG
jgi:hypothetical protein